MTNGMMKLHRWLTERLSELYEESQCEVPKLPKEIIEGEILSIKETLSFIDKMDRDSLQEEPIFKVGDTIQKKDINSIRYSIINKTSDGYRALRGLSDTIVIWFSEQDQWELVKELASEDLEEKNNELTWEDIPDILLICEKLKTSWWFRDEKKKIGTQVFWEEALKRFKEQKEKL